MTPLMLAIKAKNKELVKYLVTKARADVNIPAMKVRQELQHTHTVVTLFSFNFSFTSGLLYFLQLKMRTWTLIAYS